MKPCFKLIINGGRYNGGVRYYSSLASAVRSAKSIISADFRVSQFDSYCEIFYLQFFAPNCCKEVLYKIVK